MIKTQGGDGSHYWLGHDVCTVVRASDTNFENDGINLPGRSANVRS